jgi:uncharacterized membrane protein YraQ (UPF0718 family)
MFFVNLLITALSQTVLSFAHNWPYLLLSVVVAALMKLYLDQNKVAAFLKRYSRAGVAA